MINNIWVWVVFVFVFTICRVELDPLYLELMSSHSASKNTISGHSQENISDKNWEQDLYYFLKRQSWYRKQDLKFGILLPDFFSPHWFCFHLCLFPRPPWEHPPPFQFVVALYHADLWMKSQGRPRSRLPAGGMASTWTEHLQHLQNLRPPLSPSSSHSTWDGQVFHHFVSWAKLTFRPWPRISSLSLLCIGPEWMQPQGLCLDHSTRSQCIQETCHVPFLPLCPLNSGYYCFLLSISWEWAGPTRGFMS